MVGGGCTWSNVKGCFLGPEPVDAAGAEPEPVPVKVAEGDSIVTDVEEVACMTERWKRAGIEVESCVVGGRMRRAAAGDVVSTTTTYEENVHGPTCTEVVGGADELAGAMVALLILAVSFCSFTQISAPAFAACVSHAAPVR